ncbi:hypothetical protein EYF80_044041 [Liparis tanakae]|uniref:Uncharacterized protein n=1 Tax=Liparis tanakae TaxID=230148 RepID=A0A4Z2FWU7_9TELE|nr:hypothetical protein EYF80_044041 [Liparis tanakae]
MQSISLGCKCKSHLKLIQFWIVSLLEVSLVPDRVGGSPLSLKQPRFPGTVSGGKEEGDKIKKCCGRITLMTTGHEDSIGSQSVPQEEDGG